MMDDKDRDEAKKLCKRLDWMKINGKNDLVQWENVLSYEIARIRAEARDDERRRCAGGDMQAFMKWIEDGINPTRQRKGLCAIGYDEQVRCYEILQAFHARMQKTPFLAQITGGIL
jgi:hypothetical protein